ncbi:hypothetical protein BH10ACT1_BH10ACT1_17240 [soil metagenome]
MMKQMRLRYDGVCHACAMALPAKTSAWWDNQAKQVSWIACHEVPAALLDSPPEVVAGVEEAIAAVEVEVEPDPTPLTDDERGMARASARAERLRRSTKRDERVRTKHPKLGGVMLALTDDPTSTKVWDQGAVGEERVGAFLEEARAQGIEVLHDRLMPRSKANIDHLVIAPSGVWVVDAKRYLNGRLEKRDKGTWRSPDLRLYVGSRDQTKLLDGVQKQIDAVTASLVGTPFEAVPVRGALCFVEVQLGWFAKPFELRGIAVTWRKHLLAPMVAPVVIDEQERLALTHHLAERFRRQ